MKKYMAIAIVVLVLFTGYGCSEGDDSSPEVSSPEISGAEVVEVAKKNLLRVAKVMGKSDLNLAKTVIHRVESGEMARVGGWKLFDDLMIEHTAPETRAAYRKYRSAVLKHPESVAESVAQFRAKQIEDQTEAENMLKERERLSTIPPAQVPSGTPINNMTNVPVTNQVSWVVDNGATSYNVYFGTTNPPPYKTNTVTKSYNPGILSSNTTYYWRIDAKNKIGTTTGNIWTFTTRTNPWSTKADMPTARRNFAIAVVNSKIYAIGGRDDKSHWPHSTNEEYDPLNDTWISKADMPTARASFAIAVVNNKIYALGGLGSNKTFATNEEYDPVSNTWTAKTNMPTARYGFAVAVVNNKIYAIGGYGQEDDQGRRNYLTTNEEYDPINDRWTSKTNMPTVRVKFTIGVINNKVYIIGGEGKGQGQSYLTTNEEYDPATNTWGPKADMPTGRNSFAIGVANNKIYAIGGFGYGGYRQPGTNEEYDPATDKWTIKTDMPTARGNFAIGVVNNKIYAIGGEARGDTFAITEEYDPTKE